MGMKAPPMSVGHVMRILRADARTCTQLAKETTSTHEMAMLRGKATAYRQAANLLQGLERRRELGLTDEARKDGSTS